MREVKEKSSLKARAVETLKSAPQTAFRRGTDASFEQLRQELLDAAQDGQPEDRYESGKITDTADHAVRQAEHMAERAVHKLPKTKVHLLTKPRCTASVTFSLRSHSHYRAVQFYGFIIHLSDNFFCDPAGHLFLKM